MAKFQQYQNQQSIPGGINYNGALLTSQPPPYLAGQLYDNLPLQKGLSAPPAPGAHGGKKQDSFQNEDDDESGDGDGSDEDGSGSGDGKNKNKRRSKNDVDGRDFKCKYCDKTYLSYPALYTHMK